MSHFAKIQNNIVETVIVGSPDLDDMAAYEWVRNNLEGEWVQTSFSGKIGVNFAGIGYIWDGKGFSPPQPYPSWILDKETYSWSAPVAMPNDEKVYSWNENLQSWIEIFQQGTLVTESAPNT
jgi:hypothetical protein